MKSGKLILIACIVVLIGYLLNELQNWDLLTGMDENFVLSGSAMQISTLAFCLFSANSVMDQDNGDVDEEDYSKQSVYSVLYSLYDYLGNIETDTESFKFTFNTWGISTDPSLFPETDPERYGKTAYKSLILFDNAQELISIKHQNRESLRILEVGCGTGAGANLITKEIQKDFANIDVQYTALDMQLGAINICNKLHASEWLLCVQGNGMNLTYDNNTFDIVIISETHIAELHIDKETKIILNEINRVLKNGGVFLWGNALGTLTWNEIINYLPTTQYQSCGINNVTKEAIQARELDAGRVEHIWKAMEKTFPLFRWYPTCARATKLLLLNFYRQPGSKMFNKMVVGNHSYMQICNQIHK